jgi:hypothetical protein
MAANTPTTPDTLPAGLITGPQLRPFIGGITERTLFEWRADGCPHVKLPNKVLYSAAAVVSWLTVKYGVSGQQQAEAGETK